MDSYWVIPDNDSDISHYGVKGMKWGVRRYQNDDGSLTSLGKRREELQNAKRSKTSKRQKQIDIAYAKREFNKEKTRRRIQAKGYKKTKRQLANEKKFQDQGFTKDEAEIMAANRRRGARIAMAVGGAAVAALGAYALYKHYDRITDRMFSKGSELGRVAISDSKGLHDSFYAFRKGVKRDQANYEGLYARSLSADGRKVFRKSITATDNIKIASERNAQRVLGDILKNDKNAQETLLRTAQMLTPAQKKLHARAVRDIKRGKTDSKNVYDVFNIGLATAWGSSEMTETNDKFYDALKKRGYGAIRDVNDRQYSGYGSKDPLIFFDTSKVATTKVSELSAADNYKQLMNANKRIYGTWFAQKVGTVVGAYAGYKTTLSAVKNRADRKMIAAYRKEHPKSKMTDSEILRTLKR